MTIRQTLSLFAVCIFMMAGTSALAAGDAEKGKKIAKKCKACHTLQEGGKNGLGPNLFGILDKKAGTVEGYKYSNALLASGITWDATTFVDFITKPKKVIKGTKMSFRGIKKDGQRADLLAYFKTLRTETTESESHGTVEAGRVVATNHCVVCHTFKKGGRMVYGPNLFGIYGQPAGAIPGYTYSDALRNSGLVWNDKNLAEFVSNPEQFLPGTKARFPGLKSAQDKADVLEYLKSFQ